LLAPPLSSQFVGTQPAIAASGMNVTLIEPPIGSIIICRMDDGL
jgi:hypothetical protein